MLSVTNLGIGGTLGLLVGIALVLWVQPTNTGGTTILIVIPTLVGIAIGGAVARLVRKRDDKD
jgi:urea transporter